MNEERIYGKVAPGELYRGKGARLSEDAAKEQIELKIGTSEINRPLLQAFHLFDKAHLVMLTEEGLIPKEDGKQMLMALKKMEEDGMEVIRDKDGHGMHSGESYLIQNLGQEVGGKIHLGRSSGDLRIATGRVKIREKILELMDIIIEYRSILLNKADDHIETIMPYYTMYQHAQPTTFSHWLVRWEKPMARHFKRLKQCYKRVNQSPTGAAIITGSSFPLNRERTSELMGFDCVLQNTMDAIFAIDHGFEVYSILASIIGDLGQMSHDLLIFYTYEFRMVDFPDRFCGTSSIMPQKKNPHVLMKVPDNLRKIYGHLSAFMVETRNIVAGGKSKIATELWESFDIVIETIEILNRIMSSIIVKKERMKNLAGAFWSQATDLAAVIVQEEDYSWRTAHQIAAIVVRKAIEKNISPENLSTKLVDEAAIEYIGKPLNIAQETIAKAMDTREIVNSRTLTGGCAPSEVKRQINESKKEILQDERVPRELKEKLKNAQEKLEIAIEKIII